MKVQWTFSGGKIGCEFAYTVKQQVTLDKFRYVLAIAAPHSKYHTAGSLMLGPQGLRCTVAKDDFQATWLDTEVIDAYVRATAFTARLTGTGVVRAHRGERPAVGTALVALGVLVVGIVGVMTWS